MIRANLPPPPPPLLHGCWNNVPGLSSGAYHSAFTLTTPYMAYEAHMYTNARVLARTYTIMIHGVGIFQVCSHGRHCLAAP
jgi:hypothetical protein